MLKDQKQIEKDARDLAKLGYTQELLREMGGFSNFAVAFSVISILTGISQLYGYGLQHGGPAQMFYGWIIVAFFTLMVSLSMAELASAYPTAGALYHWSSFLGGRTVGWFTACFNTVGMFAILAGIDYGLSVFLVGLFGWPNTPWVINLLYASLLFSHSILNYRGIRIVAWLNDFSAIYHVVVVAVLIGALAMKGFRQPLSFLGTFHSTDGFHPSYSFVIGLLLAQWTLTGYDASAHVTEETVNPGKKAPWGIFFAVIISCVTGLLMLCSVTLSIADLEATTKLGDAAFLDIFKTSLGNTWGSIVVFLVAGAMWLCGLACMTSASRMIYAFARDKGLPFSEYLARVSPIHKTPATAIWTLALFAVFLSVSIKLYSALLSIATISLYISYGLPVATRLWARWRGHQGTVGPWNLGAFSTPVAVITVAWILFISVVFVLPPNEQAGMVMGGCILLLIVLWFLVVRQRFSGPQFHEK